MLGWGKDLTILSCVWGVRKRLNTLGCCKNRKILFMTEYHFLSLSPKAVHWFLQLRSRRCYLLNGSVSVADSGSFFPFVSHAQSFWSLQSPFWVAAGQGGLQVSLQPQVYQGWLPNLAPAQSGTSLFRRALMGAPSPLLCAASWECSCSLQQSMWIFFFLCITWRMCMNKHGARKNIYGQVQDNTFYFYENNPLHQLDLFGLSA